MSDEDMRAELWLEKRGAGPLPHYRLVKRRANDTPGGAYALIAGAVLLIAYFPVLLWPIVIGAVIVALLIGVLDA